MNIDVNKLIENLPNLSKNVIFSISKKSTLISDKADIYYISASDKELLANSLADFLGKNSANGEYVQPRYARDFAIAYTHFSSIHYGGNSTESSYLEDLVLSDGHTKRWYSSYC